MMISAHSAKGETMLERKYVSQCVSSDYCKGWNDAVDSIVRCKDCKHWKPSGAEAGNLFENMEPIGGCIYANFFRKASEFCSRGERR